MQVQQLFFFKVTLLLLCPYERYTKNLTTAKDFRGHAGNHVFIFLEVCNLLGFCLTHNSSLRSFVLNRFIVLNKCAFSLGEFCSVDGQQCHSMRKLHLLLELLFKIHYFICKIYAKKM